MGAQGFLCTQIPEEYGGSGVDERFAAILIEEQYRLGMCGAGFPLHSDLVAPYIVDYGTEEQKRRWLPGMATGNIISAIAMTEPSGGSDLKELRTTAKRNGKGFVLNGQKDFHYERLHCGSSYCCSKNRIQPLARTALACS